MSAPSGYPRFELETEPLDVGTVMLEASAGTGKTYAVTGICLRLLLEGVVPSVDRLLVVTFTVAAADELKNRLRAGLLRALAVCLGGSDDDPFFAGLARHGRSGAKTLRRAIDELDQVAVQTIHGFCKRLLDEAAFESREPFELEFAVDETPLWHDAAADALRMLRQDDSAMLGALLQHAKLDPEALVRLYRAWQRHPDARLEPEQPQLGVTVQNLRAAVAHAAQRWDDDAADRVLAMRWSKDDPLPGDPRLHVAQQAALLLDTPELALPFLLAHAPREARPKLRRRPPSPQPEGPFFAACDDVHAHWQRAVQHLRSALLHAVHRRLARHKREQAVLTFDDLLARTHAAVTDPERGEAMRRAVQARYAVALIDEFQDTDRRQYEVFATCFANRPLFLIGDPKQSIYGFRGADLHTYLEAREHALRRTTLAVNFRSSDELVRAVAALFERADAFVETEIRMPAVRAKAARGALRIDGDDGPAMRFRALPELEGNTPTRRTWSPAEARQRIVADVTAEIRRLLSDGAHLDGRRLLPRDVAVLTRRNVEAVLVQEALRDAGIVAVIGKAGDVFDTDEVAELRRLLLAILRPNDLGRARAAMATRLWGHDAAALAAISADDGRLEAELANLERWRQVWLKRGFVAMKEQLLADLDADARLLSQQNGERRLTNFQQLCEMLHQAEHEHRLSPEGLLHWLEHESRHKDEIDYQRRELRLESDEDAVQILTMHGSKGLQYEVVFCPFLWDGRQAQRRDTVLADADSQRRRFVSEADEADPDWLAAEQERIAEDVRLAYVALTRAKRRCYVHWGPIGGPSSGYYRSALGWLLNPDEVDRRTTAWQTAWQRALKDRPESVATRLEALAAQHPDAIGVERLAVHAPPAAAVATRELAPPRARRQLPLPRRSPLTVHSFSSLVAGAAPVDVVRDVRDPGRDDAPPGAGIVGFALGADAGTCRTEVIEHVDWQALDSDATATLVARTLAQHGLASPTAHASPIDPQPVVLQNLRDLAAARVQADGPSLAALCSGERAAEWQFTMAVTRPDLLALARLLLASGDAVTRTYAGRAAELPRQQLAGFLTGFVDLVAAHDGRYWVLDWKSNHLGDAISDYGPEPLAQAMVEHDYVLQYHLYVLALHRHLRARVADYDYDRHFGGVAYVFLRGAAPGATSGMFHARPSRALVEALDDWAGGASGGDA